MLLRFYLRLALIPILLFTVVLLLVHSQPSDDHDLHEFLQMRGCVAPCLMGIIPDETGHEAALELLQEHPWVEKITYEDSKEMRWAWSGQQPNWIETTIEGSVSFYNDTVSSIQLGLTVALGDIVLVQNGANRLKRFFFRDHEYTVYELAYPESGAFFTFAVGCNEHIPYLQPMFMNVIKDFTPPITSLTIPIDSLKSLHKCPN